MVNYYTRVMEYKKGTGHHELEVKTFATILERDTWVTDFNADRLAAVFEVETPPDDYTLAQSYYPTEDRRQELTEQANQARLLKP